MFGKALQLNPKLPNSLDGTGKAYSRKGQPEKAAIYFQRAVDLQPDSAKMHFQLGQALMKAGQQERGRQEIAKAGKLQERARKDFEETVSGKLPPPAVRQADP